MKYPKLPYAVLIQMSPDPESTPLVAYTESDMRSYADATVKLCLQKFIGDLDELMDFHPHNFGMTRGGKYVVKTDVVDLFQSMIEEFDNGKYVPHQVPLTESELSSIMDSVNFTYNPTKFARAVEQAHGIYPEEK